MEKCQLPVEILEAIIQYVPEPDTSVALSQSDIVTRTLHSCLFVSKATFASSLELLYRKCLFIDSARRLRSLLRSYDSAIPIFGRKTEPKQFRAANSQSVFLAPFSSDTIDEILVVDALSRLFGILANNIKRLVIDMPLRSYYPDEPGSPNLRSSLRSAFMKLKAVEEFVSVRDELYLATTIPLDLVLEPHVWSSWSQLRKLALYNLDVELLDQSLHLMPNLKTIVLTRPDTEADLDRRSRNWDPSLHIVVVNTWRDHIEIWRPLFWFTAIRRGGANALGSQATLHRPRRDPPPEDSRCFPVLDVVCTDGQNPVQQARGVPLATRNNGQELAAVRSHRGNNWAAYDLRNTFNDIRFCQDWVKQNALRGELWPKETLDV